MNYVWDIVMPCHIQQKSFFSVDRLLSLLQNRAILIYTHITYNTIVFIYDSRRHKT